MFPKYYHGIQENTVESHIYARLNFHDFLSLKMFVLFNIRENHTITLTFLRPYLYLKLTRW